MHYKDSEATTGGPFYSRLVFAFLNICRLKNCKQKGKILFLVNFSFLRLKNAIFGVLMKYRDQITLYTKTFYNNQFEL
jgi:hypothetical protein